MGMALHCPLFIVSEYKVWSSMFSRGGGQKRGPKHQNRLGAASHHSKVEHGRSNTRKPDDKVITGSGSVSGIRSSKYDSRPNKPNRVCTGLFVTRLHPRTTNRQIEDHVQKATGYAVRVEKLETHYQSYASFYVRADKNTREALFDASVWPKGSMVKLFFD